VYLGSSAKLGKQLTWANDQRARSVVIYGPEEQQAREVTVRNMDTGDQTRVPFAEIVAHLRSE
jgi:histidyl-tRNA synthetase